MPKSGLSSGLQEISGRDPDEPIDIEILDCIGALSGDDIVAGCLAEWSTPNPMTPPRFGHEDRHEALTFITRTLCKSLLERIDNLAIFRMQSPLEETFLYAIIVEAWRQGGTIILSNKRAGKDLDLSLHDSWDESIYRVTPQDEISGMHPDFVIRGRFFDDTDSGDPTLHESCIAIECDGHDFHEKTKEQARRDKKRDRDLSSLGMPVVRFTGSEIFKEPFKHAKWALDHCKHLAFRPAWERRFRTDQVAALDALKKNKWRRTFLLQKTGLSLEQWAKRIGFECPEVDP